MNNNEEATKIPREARWAVLGRAIADAVHSGQPTTALVVTAAMLRRQEQENWSRTITFAAITRQIGDAARTGKEYDHYIAQLASLRWKELGTPDPAKHELDPWGEADNKR